MRPKSASDSRRGSPRSELASPELDPEAGGSLRPPRWARQTSRYSNTSSSSAGHPPYRDDEDPAYGHGVEMSEVAAAAGLPLPAFSRDSSGRVTSMASSNMLSISGSDYDSVYQLWRNSGTPSTLAASDRRGSYMSAATREASAADLAMIEQYRSGTLPAGSGGSGGGGGRAKGFVGLTRGQGGAKGPKDYRAVGLGKYGPGKDRQMSRKKRWLIALGAVLALIVLAVVIVVPLSQTVFKSQDGSSSASKDGGDVAGSGGKGSKDGSDAAGNKPAVDPKELVATWGTDGSTINLDNGKSFTYRNSFGGHWASQPLNDTARAQNYTPPLNEEFDYSTNRILGVNLGGWLVTEPFIVPALYEPYENETQPAVDEFTLSQRYREEGGLERLRSRMTEHYETFITEKDFADIAAAGLNWVRIPIGFWAIETLDNEPFLPQVSWTYLLRAIGWARKYGLRINLDLHATSGSQNGYNHSGRLGKVNFLMGPMGYANGQRTLAYIERIAEFISQPSVRNVVPMLSVVNEPLVLQIGEEAARAWYSAVYQRVRSITGEGRGKGPYLVIHDGFLSLSSWNGFLSGADRVAWDTHPYLAFGQQNNDAWDQQIMKPCQQYGPITDNGRANLGVTMGGETSLAVNDCGLFVNGVGDGARYDGSYRGPSPGNFPRVGSCRVWDDWENYSDEMKTGLRRFALNAMDSLHNFFFWTWRIGDSLRTGKPTSPMWSYQLGLEQGWMPRDPLRSSSGSCQAQAARLNAFTPQTTHQTAIVAGDPNPSPSFGAWTDAGAARPMYTPISGCRYPADQYDLSGWSGSGWPCGGGGGGNGRRDVDDVGPTPRP
ncbi:uncharacterized protein PFL1_05366 [Pseudozyma flocculosa PF-1]|uniref:glucan 1,3-beta-glucosidase n=1 Tax=Pseudozyma flocculosa PF-1 TaxID=1277687 RepID=A0A061H2W8_9BASI|nr:uncharacterized protein PFL1_05366 [Pseudozyma flocculosa PF-1]EPQ27082.1 hypothetical protein PFL1_05366 [Pseudozyma flocculosa PF-1]